MCACTDDVARVESVSKNRLYKLVRTIWCICGAIGKARKGVHVGMTFPGFMNDFHTGRKLRKKERPFVQALVESFLEAASLKSIFRSVMISNDSKRATVEILQRALRTHTNAPVSNSVEP